MTITENNIKNNLEPLISTIDENTIILTSTQDKIDELTNQKLLAALQSYDPTNRKYSAYYTDSSSSTEVTPERVKELSKGIHSTVTSVQEANIIIKNLIVLNDIVGKTYESLDSNIRILLKNVINKKH